MIGDEASEVGADYTDLRKFLNNQEFGKADFETTNLMLKIANRERKGYFERFDFLKFPGKDLVTIDTLWRLGSNGRFGFSVQKKIWMELVENQSGKSNQNSFKQMIDKLEWKENPDYDFIFKLRGKEGHLPLGIYVYCTKNAKLIYKYVAAVERARTWENAVERAREGIWLGELREFKSISEMSEIEIREMIREIRRRERRKIVEKWVGFFENVRDLVKSVWEWWRSRGCYLYYIELLSRKDLPTVTQKHSSLP